MRLRPHLLNVLLLVASLTFVIGGLEFVLRVTGLERGRAVPPPIYQRSASPEISYELIPNLLAKAFRSTIKTNSLGFRSPEINTAKPTLALLGDSITFGYGVEDEETLGAILQDEFGDWNIVNAAVPGYNVRQERATYERKLAPLNPKALVLVFYWNDLENPETSILADDGNIRPANWVDDGRGCDPIQTGILSLIPGSCWLDTHSSVYRVIKKMAIARSGQAELAKQEQEQRDNAFGELLPPERLQDYGRELDALVALLPPEMPRLFVIWPEKRLHLLLRPQLQQLAESRGFKVLDLYGVFGNSPRTLSWDTVHPHPETIATAGGIVADAMRYFGIVR